MARNLFFALLVLVAGAGALSAQAPRQNPLANPPAAPATPFPLEVFARLPETERPRINTDGTALAAKIRVGGIQALAYIPLDTPNPHPIMIGSDGDFDQRGDVRTTDWRWIDPDNLLIWIASLQDLDGENVDSTRVLAWNRRTRHITALGWEGTFVQGGDVIWMSHSGAPHILLSRLAAGRGYERLFNPEVIDVDVTTGRQTRVIAPQVGITEWVADGAGNVRLGLGRNRDTGRLTALYRAGGEGNFRTLINERPGRYDTSPVPIAFLPGDKALAISRQSGFRALYELDLTTMQLGRQIFGVDGYDIDEALPSPDGDAIDGVIYTRDHEEYHWMNPRLREIQQVLDETFGEGRARIVSADRPRVNLVVRVGSPNQMGAFYLYNVETGAMRNIGWANSALRDMTVNPVRTVHYRASDGQTIAAVLTLPRLREARDLPLIVLPHGGPWARDEESWDIWAQPLAEMGYAVIQPNYRGSSGFGQAWEAMSDGNWGTRMQDDLNDAVDYLAHEGIADPARVCMFGWSYGGYAAARAAQRDGGRYRCAISGAGPTDLQEMVAHDRNYLGQYGSQYIGSAAAGRLADISPARHASEFSAPIMIVHGVLDQRVPVSQSRNLVARLRSAGKVEGRDFVYVEQPRNTHNLPREEDRLQLLVEAQRFLRAHNPSGMAEVPAGALPATPPPATGH